MVISMLQYLSYMYFSHDNITSVSFDLIYYVINMSIVLSFMVFNEFIYMFLSIYC